MILHFSKDWLDGFDLGLIFLHLVSQRIYGISVNDIR
jgi:hypothetical protein